LQEQLLQAQQREAQLIQAQQREAQMAQQRQQQQQIQEQQLQAQQREEAQLLKARQLEAEQREAQIKQTQMMLMMRAQSAKEAGPQQAGGVQSAGRGMVAEPLFVPQSAPANALGNGAGAPANAPRGGVDSPGAAYGAGAGAGAGAGNSRVAGSQMGNMGQSPMSPQMHSEQSGSDAIIYQIAYGAAGPMGIAFTPLTLAYELGDGQYQIVHVAAVRTNSGGSSIQPGDIILSVNGLPLVGSPADTVGGDEFMQRVVSILTTQPSPRVMRYFRCSTVDVNYIQMNPFPSPVALSDADAVVFLEG
jgi:hypothetical protein